jgi:hypothetical protein
LFQVKMQLVTANLHVQLKINPGAESCRLQGCTAVLCCVVICSDLVCKLTGIDSDLQQLKSQVCLIYTENSLTERTSGEGCLKIIPRILHGTDAEYQDMVYS